jgi:hypothetical protein
LELVMWEEKSLRVYMEATGLKLSPPQPLSQTMANHTIR